MPISTASIRALAEQAREEEWDEERKAQELGPYAVAADAPPYEEPEGEPVLPE